MLRSATQADLDPLIALAKQPAIARTLAFDAASRLASALESESGELLVIEDAGAFAGGVRWTYLNHRSRIAEIRTLMLDPAAHGRGLATTAVLDLVERLIAAHDMHRIEAEVLGFNDAAQNVFERAGFVREGARRRAYDREGAWQDGIRFGLLADERV
jgi:aminoglycoside 6'-N-acetyltransferase